MAFILVLLLSITTLVRVETSAAAISAAKMQAEQNALLGLNIALGELQRSTGPDQRVTATANQWDADPNTLEEEEVVNPLWMAVYKTSQPSSKNQVRELLRIWSTDILGANRVDWLVSSRSDLSDGTNNPVNTTAETLNGGADNVVLMAEYADNAGNVVRVKAGKLDVASIVEDVGGRYAWWVTDESLKFRINTTKDEAVLNAQPFVPHWSLMVPHQSNLSIIPELSSFDPGSTNQQSKLDRSNSPESLQLIDSSWSEWTNENQNDYSMVSRSLPVDVTQGRLKEDLTVYLESNSSGLNDSDNVIRGSDTDSDYTGQLNATVFQLDHSLYKLPQFGLIKSWYENGMQISGLDGGTPQAPRAHASHAHGLHPVIMRTALYFGVSFDLLPDGNLIPYYLVFPKFVLWNPYNVPIAPAKYVIQVRALTTLNTQINVGGTDYAARNITQGFNYVNPLMVSPHNPNPNTFHHFNLAGGAGLERDSEDGYPYFTFVIDNEGFAPGETLYYTAGDKHPDASYVNTDISNVPADFSNHNLLVNKNEGTIGFFYLRAGARITPIPNNVGDPLPITANSDILTTSVYFRDTFTNAPDGASEPSLTTKLYLFKNQGNFEILQYLDMSGVDLAGTNIDWEHIDTEGNSVPGLYTPLTDFTEYRSLSVLKASPFLATPHRGHGYFINPMGNSSGGYEPRTLARQNLAVKNYALDDPLVSDMSKGGVYAESIPTENWFNGPPFPAEIPSDVAYAGVSADGYDTLGGFGLYENSDNFTQSTVYPLYDSARSETGLLSLGFLKNANFSQYYWQPSFPFGNSEAHTHVSRNNIKASHGSSVYTDLSYLLNESLFDRFFVSTIPQAGAFEPAADFVLPNTRNRLTPRVDGSFPDAASLRASSTAFQQAAANIAIEGGFNVNSTSVDAWRMFLASFLGESVTAADGNASNLPTKTPLTSKLYPLLSEGAAINPSLPRTWSALRSLTPSEVNRLAEAIVEEVKRRGPFLSLSDFVNRRFVPDAADPEADFLGLKGTLQAAIDKVSISGANLINEAFYQGSLEASPSVVPDNSLYPEHETGMPAGLSGSRMFGVPGYLTQADILSALSPLMTVRGDTFTIRAYGESTDIISNKTKSKAWCEAVVQRIADPVDTGDSIVQPTGLFGRAYKVISFRWLSEDEVI